MRQRIRPSRSGLLAIEMTVAVGVFALCAAISIGLLVRAELLSQKSSELTHAVSQARNAAECYKAARGDMEETARLLGVWGEEDGVRLVYDSDWHLQPEGQAMVYVLTLMPLDTPDAVGVCEAELTVSDREGTSFLTWTVAAWEDLT